VSILTFLLAAAAVGMFTLLTSGTLRPPSQPTIPWWALAAMYALAEALVVHLAVGRETHSFSLNEVPLVLGLFLATPGDLLLGQAVGAGLALAIHRRNSVRKLAFNLSSFAFSTTIALLVFQTLGDPSNVLGPRDWIAGFLAALVADFMSSVTVQAVIAVSTGEPPDWSGSVTGAVYVLANASLGLVGTLLLIMRPETSWLAAVLTLAMLGAYRISEKQRERHVRLLGLHDATREVQEALSSSAVTTRLLERARQMFGAEVAELLVLPHGGGPALRTRVSPEGSVEQRREDQLDATEGVWARVAAEGEGVRLSAADAPERLREYLEAEGVRDLMAAPVRGEEGVVAVLTLMNRHGNVGGWGEEEVPLLETLANHAGIALRNGELMEGLAARAAENEHQARHDALTGLPNRTWFAQLVDNAIGRGDKPVALLTLDLDRFKEINDTLGHRNGDEILRAVAVRLQSILLPNEIVARLSADEFALLVPGVPAGTLAVGSPVDAAQLAAVRVQRCLEDPFEVGGLLLNVAASVGVAMVGVDGEESGVLLRHADVAMYQAKAGHAPVEFYSRERDEFSPARLALAGEFRRAVESNELVAWYQPKVDIATGRIVGAEALARWIHPVRGLVRPDEFIPIVEQTSLLRPMTLRVLRSAIGRCAEWHGQGFPLSVAVNLSARNLLDPELPGDIQTMLDDAGLPATSLTLEVTESAMMSDPERAIAILGELRSLGCRIAVDDFGTGHASLAYLKRLPVDELKIDKSFVMGLEADGSDRSIVRSTIELAHELGLTAVAEGVETAWVLEWLGTKGCDLAQGFYFSTAVAAVEFERLLRSQSEDVPESLPPGPPSFRRPLRRPVRATPGPGLASGRSAAPRVGLPRPSRSRTG
jgi:diguanylate cyclase (GGDEF)-like protein